MRMILQKNTPTRKLGFEYGFEYAGGSYDALDKYRVEILALESTSSNPNAEFKTLYLPKIAMQSGCKMVGRMAQCDQKSLIKFGKNYKDFQEGVKEGVRKYYKN